MTTRRDILKTGATALALTSLSHRAFGLAAGAGQTLLPFDAIIVDERIGGNEALSRLARASGIQCVSIRGDLTRLWFDSLRGECFEKSIVVAGFTSDLDSEVMRAFARDVGYRQELRLDISIDVETGRETIRRSFDPVLPPELAVSSKLENMVDRYMTMAMQASDQRGPTQLAAWVVAPIRG
ncbi:MAG: hypothetical protein OXQ29_28200 [Rhodospirillaceae bacterium]|nr:hypothetical protein [Rhodospirillaceae bacterium]